jgi:uncharacterized protein YukE
MGKIYMDIDEVLDQWKNFDSYAVTFWNAAQQVKNLANNVEYAGWWQGEPAEYFARSLRNWASDFVDFVEKYSALANRLYAEWNEWGETDCKYSYEGEEIDTLAELWTWLSEEMNEKGEGYIKIDLKEILFPEAFWYDKYPPASTTIWMQDAQGRWRKIEITPADWSFDLKIGTGGVSVDYEWTFYSVEATCELGGGVIATAGLDFLSAEVSVGSGGAKVGGSVASVDGSIGVNTDDGSFVGLTAGVDIIGGEYGLKDGEVSLGGVSGGIKQSEEKDVAPQETPPD